MGRKIVAGVLAIGVFAGVADYEGWLNDATPAATADPRTAERPVDPDPSHACLASWSVRQLVGQVVVAGIPGTDLAAYRKAFREDDIGGAILMSSPSDPYDGSIKKFKDSETVNGKIVPILMSTDQEGGSVLRFKYLHLPNDVPPMPSEKQAATMSPAEVQKIVNATARQLEQIGIDQDDAPVADRAQGAIGNQAEDPLGSRVYSQHESVVRRYSVVAARAMIGAGIIPTFKHFPGALSANSDITMSTSPPLSQLRRNDFAPYYALEKMRQNVAIMVGTTKVPKTSGKLPADLSRAVITGELRQREGFNGPNDLVLTDDLATKPIADLGYSVPRAVETAIEAGADEAMVVVVPKTPGAVRAQFARIVGRLTAAVYAKRLNIQQLDSSVLRVLNAKQYKCQS